MNYYEKILTENNLNYSIDWNCSAEPFITQEGNLTKVIQKVIENKINVRADLSTTGGTSDARFISKICPVIEFGIVGKTMHKINENINIRDLEDLSKIYLYFINNVFKPKS